ASRERFDKLPNVPTFAEAGYPGFEAAAWFGILVPAKTSKEIIAQHVSLFSAAVGSPEVQAKLAAQGFRQANACGDAFGAHIRQQYEAYARVIKDADIRAD